MEPLWSPAVATGGKRSQIEQAREPRKQAKTVAVGCRISFLTRQCWLSAARSTQIVPKAARLAGAAAYMTKSRVAEDLIATIYALSRGENFVLAT